MDLSEPDGPDSSDEYWARPFDRAAEMAEKYGSLVAALAQAGKQARNRALRDAAMRWPGCLRECQLVDPALYEARAAAAAGEVGTAPVARSSWRRRDQAAVCLWSDLHDLLRDQRDAPVEPGSPRPRARAAMLALAGRAGLSPAALAELLFGRPGLWRP